MLPLQRMGEFMTKFFAAIGFAFALLIGAQANATIVLVDQTTSMGSTTSVINALLADNGVDKEFFTRLDSNGDVDESGSADSAFSDLTLTGDGTQGTFTFDLSSFNKLLTHFVIKAGNNFYLFEISADMVASSGTFNWEIPGQMALSNINFYGMDVPIPGAIWLMGAGLAGLGFAGRKKKKA